MEKTYRVQNLVLKFTPAIIKLFGFSYNWAKEDAKFDERIGIRENYLKRNNTDRLVTKQTFIDLLVSAESNDQSAIGFLNFVNDLVEETLSLVPEAKNKIKDNFDGKLTSTQDWNYLNPIGEIACLKKLISSGTYRLKSIECAFPNGKTKDYLFENINSKNDIMIEVLNIHPKTEFDTPDDKIIDDIIAKLRSKIISETLGIDPQTLKVPLIFMPVVWNISVECLERNMEFFSSFSVAGGRQLGVPYDIVGFSTLLKKNNSFYFGEICSHLK
jgi:hypothetical protein